MSTTRAQVKYVDIVAIANHLITNNDISQTSQQRLQYENRNIFCKSPYNI